MHKAGPTVDFMRKMMKFQKMPLLLLPMSQKYGRNSGNFPNCNTDNMYCHTQLREKDEILYLAPADGVTKNRMIDSWVQNQNFDNGHAFANTLVILY